MDAVRADGISALRAGNARLGSPSGGAGAQRLRGTYTNPAALPFRGGKPLRRRRADEGIGPYKVQRKIEGCGRTESSAPTGCDARSEEWCACIGMAEDVGYEMKGAGLHVYR